MNIEKVIGKSPVITKILDCTTITPLLMHGKENKKLAELRAPSFTGVFRYWFRALQPASSASMISMFQEESDLFGGTRRKSKKSPLVVSVSSLSAEEHHYNTRPHAPYKKPPTIVPGIPENKSFQLQLQTYLKDEHLFDTVLTYAKISFYLGGLHSYLSPFLNCILSLLASNSLMLQHDPRLNRRHECNLSLQFHLLLENYCQKLLI